MIETTINGHKLKLKEFNFKQVPDESSEVYRSTNSKLIKEISPCDWPFKKMRDETFITIPWGLATPRQVKTALRSYCRASGSLFDYRRTAKGMKIFCLKQK